MSIPNPTQPVPEVIPASAPPYGQPEIRPILNRISDLGSRIRHLTAHGHAAADAAALTVVARDHAAATEDLIDALSVRAYPAEDHPDVPTEQVVVSVFGVDVSIRRREHDLFVHVDSTERTARDVAFVVEVNNAGEQEYGQAERELTAEQKTYLAAAADALSRRREDLQPYLTRTCPECGQVPGEYDTDHGLMWGLVVLGCEGYYVVNPTLLGVDAPNWQPTELVPYQPGQPTGGTGRY